MANILITGATGFIGSFLVEKCLAQGHHVIAGVRSSSKLNLLPVDKIQLLTLNLADPNHLVKVWNELNESGVDIDYVIHNAGVTIATTQNQYDKVNFRCTQNLYDSLSHLSTSPKKFVFISSLAAMGPGNPISGKPVGIEDIPNPVTAYGRSKRKAEIFLQDQSTIPYIIIRPTAVYGPRDKDFLEIFSVIRWRLEPYLANPKQQLSFIHVEDLVTVIENVTTSNIINRIFQVSDGNTYSVEYFMLQAKAVLNVKTLRIKIPKFILKFIVEIMELKIKIFKVPSNLNRDKYKELTAMNWACDNNHLYQELGIKPKYNIKSGLKNVLSWYQKEGLL
ncbi:SDR family NAD(P)-dependent oxidoreductase [Halosquirtibacter laminarini]|uniref:SDR family NAD(P)-dependent oxidoreductase n=1 Tax=Halosquirtibacter laminarini TaxID=3374600 RepID=A0AC61NND6_9BACT|nr:SDR family NAD(P)-dependent oxidoreductase [Prolixibacteraceae bacterium]